MGNRKEVHVVPNNVRGGWDIKRDNAQKASEHFERKEDAVTAAIIHAKNIGAEMITHRKDGVIQNPNSYKNDPCPPKDNKH